MSSVQIPLASVIENVVDFTSKPAYLVHNNQCDAAFLNIIPINSYSSSLISVKLNLSNALSQVLDRVIVMNVPIKFNITGSRVDGSPTAPLLCDGEWGCRSNAFLKVCNVTSILLGSASQYSLDTQNGLIINALEASGPMPSWSRQLNNYDNQMVDNVANYDDVLYTNRSVLGLYANNTGCDMGRCAYDIDILSNTPTSASMLVTFRFAVFVSPLLQDIHVNGGQAGLTHIDSVNLNFTLTNLATRLLSFARETNNGTLVISNIAPSFGPNFPDVPQPTLEFTTYNIISQYFKLPESVDYQLPVLDRYNTLVSVPYGSTAVVSSPVVSLNTVPSYALIFACYPNSLYSSQGFTIAGDANPIHGTQLTDSFCPISQVIAQVNSVQYQSNSTPQSLWRAYVKNGGCKSFVEWSGRKVIKTLLAPDGIPQYLYPASGPVKLNFSNDLVVRSPDGTTLSPGTNFKHNVSFNVQITNSLKYSSGQLELYVVFVYPQLLKLAGINNSQIYPSVLSIEDNMSVRDKQPTGHASALNSHDLVGWGLMGKLHKMMTHPRMAHKLRKHRFHRTHMKHAIAHAMPSVLGMGVTGGMKKHSRKHSRKSALKFH